LLQVLWFGAGGLDALGRHAVAALLNAAHPYTSPPPAIDTPAEVILAFQKAFDSGNYEATKNMFAAANSAGCPMDACGKHK
jgi:alcohol dehydrogenase class IV